MGRKSKKGKKVAPKTNPKATKAKAKAATVEQGTRQLRSSKRVKELASKKNNVSHEYLRRMGSLLKTTLFFLGTFLGARVEQSVWSESILIPLSLLPSS